MLPSILNRCAVPKIWRSEIAIHLETFSYMLSAVCRTRRPGRPNPFPLVISRSTLPNPSTSFPALLVALLLTFGTLHPTAWAASPEPFALGNARYAAGDFAGAAQAYEDRVRQGDFSANGFYNLGDAYYRLGDRGRAILNYRRALLLEPSHAEAAANLAFIGGGKAGEGRSGKAAVWAVVPWVAAACGWLGVAGLLTAAASRRYRTLGFGAAALGLLLGALGAGLIRSFDDSAGIAARAVVVTEAAPALYSPADSAKVVTTLPAGGEVRVLSEQGAWLYVLLGDGTTRAWLAAKGVERIVPK